MKIDIDLFRKYYVVACEKSINKAAKKMKMSQSSLSRDMSVLEYQLQESLLERTDRGVILTSSGVQAFDYARNLTLHHEEFINRFLEKKNDLFRPLRIITFSYLGSDWLMGYMREFMDQFSDIVPQIVISVTDERQKKRPFDFDVSLGDFLYNQPGLIQKELFENPHGLYASVDYLDKYGTPLSESDLNNHRLIFYKDHLEKTSYRRDGLFVSLRRRFRLPGTASLEVDDLKGMLNATLSDCGISEIPLYAAHSYPQLRQVLPELTRQKLPIYFTYHKAGELKEKILVLYEFLQKKIKFLNN